MAMYRLEWQHVATKRLYKYYNADPMYYSNAKQMVPNSQVDEEDWITITKEANAIEMLQGQYEKLKEWSEADEEFVRNVKLYEAEEPRWREVR